MKPTYRLIFWGGLTLLLGLVLVAFAVGRYPITPQMLVEIVYAKVANVPHDYTSTVETVLFQLWLPRILVAMMVGSDYRKLLPTSMIYGSAFLLLVDTVARTLFTSELPLSILTAFIGAPFFLYLMTNYGGGAWASK